MQGEPALDVVGADVGNRRVALAPAEEPERGAPVIADVLDHELAVPVGFADRDDERAVAAGGRVARDTAVRKSQPEIASATLVADSNVMGMLIFSLLVSRTTLARCM